MTKICNQCDTLKELDKFYKDKNMPDGLRKNCKACKDLKTRNWRETNREKYNEYMRKKNKEAYSIDRLGRYGLTPEQHEKMLIEQEYKCKICKKSPSGVRPLTVDYNHKIGHARGLLCFNCNRLIGALDSHPLHSVALEYIKIYENKLKEG